MVVALEESEVQNQGVKTPTKSLFSALLDRVGDLARPHRPGAYRDGVHTHPPESVDRPLDSLAAFPILSSPDTFSPLASPSRLPALPPAPSTSPSSKFLASFSLYESSSDVYAEEALKRKAEVFNHICQGRDVFDKSGNSYRIVFWGETEDSTPIGISISKVEQGRVSRVIQYDIPEDAAPSARIATGIQLVGALQYLENANRFDHGVRRLDEIVRSGRVTAQSFKPQESVVTAEQLVSLKDFEASLVRSGIDTSTWNKDGAKSVQALFEDVKNGEVALRWIGHRGYIEEKVVLFDLIHIDPVSNQRMRLIEEKQVMFRQKPDGTPFIETRIRPDNGQSPAEKIKVAERESAINAVIRGMKEELDIHSHHSIKEVSFSRKVAPSQNCPGMFQCNVFRRFQVEIYPGDYREEYRELSATKETICSWVPFTNADEQALFRIDQGTQSPVPTVK